jgi:repressor of nif and glnA expression
MTERTERKRLHILKILKESKQALGSLQIAEQLNNQGVEISERTVRFHLLALDRQGFTRNMGTHGRQITKLGEAELSRARIFEKVGFLNAQIDQMTYRMSFNPTSLEGTVIVNASLLRKKDLMDHFPLMLKVFESGYSMGRLLTLFRPTEQVGEMIVPKGYIGVGTVCSVSLNGVLLAYGIPTVSRFGGLLEIQAGKPVRFVAIINYDGTTLDPLEIFITSRMTRYTEAVETGNGLIGVGFREIPAASRDRVVDLAARLERIGLGGIMEIGWPGQPLLEVPIDEGRIGAIVIGGLNPVAILEEHGIEVASRALSGLVDYRRLFPYAELAQRLGNLR